MPRNIEVQRNATSAITAGRSGSDRRVNAALTDFSSDGPGFDSPAAHRVFAGTGTFPSLWRRQPLLLSDRGSKLRERRDVVATKVERHRPDVREVEEDTALPEPGRDHIDESDFGNGELGEQATRKWCAAGVDDKEPTAGHDERAIVTIRSVNALAYLALWALRSLGGGREGQNGDDGLPGVQRVTDSLEDLRPLLGVLRL
ncbi:MAG TPA: hypothetical protein VGO38_04745 [Acidimicrobiia bacterium]